MSKKRFYQRGQGMTEYVIIVALVGVAAIGVYQFFGQALRSQMGGIALEVSGKDAGEAIKAAQGAADSAKGEGDKTKGLGTYGSGGSGNGTAPGGGAAPAAPGGTL